MQRAELWPLIKLVREKIAKSKTIVVYGWLPKNHSDETLGLAKTKLVRFVEKSTRKNGISKHTFVLLTKFIEHSDVYHLKSSGIEYHPHVLSPRQIKDVLQGCKNMFDAVIEMKSKQNVPMPLAEVRESDDLDELEQKLYNTEEPMDQYDKLAERFKEKSAEHPERLVSVREMTAIMQEIEGLPDKIKLRKESWIVPVTQEGKKKAGWYEAGPKLLERMSRGLKEEPADPIEKALWLIENEQYFKDELEKAQEIRAQAIEEADAFVAQKQRNVERVNVAIELIGKLSLL